MNPFIIIHKLVFWLTRFQKASSYHFLTREGETIDIVLSDVSMPEMGGQELLDRAR